MNKIMRKTKQFKNKKGKKEQKIIKERIRNQNK